MVQKEDALTSLPNRAQYTVALAGDYRYIRQIETTLKSLIFHNRQVKVYLFNQDIPKEWFTYYKLRFKELECDLVDVKLWDVDFNTEWTLNENLYHINHMTFARYYIPQFVEEDFVLYLDCDIVITDDISDLFNLDISQYYLAASRAVFGYGFGFNAGVMFINNRRWKEEGIQSKLIDVTNREYLNVAEGDQTILNRLLGHEYLLLEDTYNFQIGYDRGASHYKHRRLFEISLDPLPKILHYVSPDKPWNTFSSGRLRDIWWQYHLMEWDEIREKWQIHRMVISPKKSKGKLLVITNTHLLQGIEELVEALPEYEFHIAAFTDMAGNLKQLSSKDNVYLHPHVIGYLLEEMIKDCDIYLDINNGGKLDDMLALVIENQKQVISFDNVVATIFEDYQYGAKVSPNHPEEVIRLIQFNDVNN